MWHYKNTNNNKEIMCSSKVSNEKRLAALVFSDKGAHKMDKEQKEKEYGKGGVRGNKSESKSKSENKKDS